MRSIVVAVRPRARTHLPALRHASSALALVLAIVAIGPGAVAQAQTRPVARTLTERIDGAMEASALDLMGDQEALRAWVAARITPETYDGVLKGARGTYLTRSGNSADTALLLGALLDLALVDHRYATCDLAAAVAPAAVEDATPALDGIAAALPSLPDGPVKAALAEALDLRATQHAAGAVLAADLEAQLTLAPTIAAPVAAMDTPPTSRHVWVQAATGAEWRDLDTTTADGSAPCTAASTMDELPDAWSHRLHIALEVEQRTGVGMTLTDQLAVDLSTADIATSRIAFGFGERSGFLGALAWTPGALAGYTPILLIDGQPTSGARVSLPPSDATVRNPLDGVLDAFGSPDPSAAPAEPEPITGAWLRIELVDPTGTATTLRSEVFDRIGRAARASGETATAPVQPLAQVLGEYPDIGSMWQIGVLLGEARAPEAAADGTVDPAAPDGVSGALDELLRIYPAAYRDLGGRPAGPIVLLAGIRPEATADGQPASRLVLDALRVPGERPADAAATALDATAAAGAEELLVRLVGLVPSPLGSAPSVFQAAADQGIPLRWLAPGDVVDIDGASPQAVAGMTRTLAGGAALLTPARTPDAPDAPDGSATAWFVLDPGTGLLRDEHESGRHQALPERTVEEAPVPSWGERFRRVACKVAGVAVVAGSILFVTSGGQDGGDLIEAVVEASEKAQKNREAGEEARKIACGD